MGWWPIDPQTGQYVEGKASSLSKPPEFVLLNAVPGADDEEGANYLGDGPSDMVSTLPKELADITDCSGWSADDIRRLFLQDKSPPQVAPEVADQLREVVAAFWKDINWCYEEDWERGATAAEKYWICEEIVSRVGPGAST